MVLRLKFVCSKCGFGNQCEVIVHMQNDQAMPAWNPCRCVLSSHNDKLCDYQLAME